MKTWTAFAYAIGATLSLLKIVRAEPPVMVDPAVTVSSSTSVVPVIVPAAVIVPTVVTSRATVPQADREREGDWYVARGTIELDRPKRMLRVDDGQGHATELVYGNDVRISRAGQPVSYLDVSSGDYVVVRYKEAT